MNNLHVSINGQSVKIETKKNVVLLEIELDHNDKLIYCFNETNLVKHGMVIKKQRNKYQIQYNAIKSLEIWILINKVTNIRFNTMQESRWKYGSYAW